MTVNTGDPELRAARKAVRELSEFLSGSGLPRLGAEKFFTVFEDRYGFEPDVSNKRFWREFLGLK